MLAGRRFQFRPGLTVATVLALAVLVSLGHWQLQRLDWKRDLIAQVEARRDAAPIAFDEAVRRAEAGESMEYAPVTLTGAPVSDSAALVFGTYDGAPGAYVFSSLNSAAGVVYVNNGFAPQTVIRAREDLSVGLLSDGEPVTGLLRYPERPSPPASWFKPQSKSPDGFWHVRDPEAFAGASGDASPYYVDRFAVSGRDWPQGGTTRLAFTNRHLEYALTWFGLAATLFGVWLASSLPRR